MLPLRQRAAGIVSRARPSGLRNARSYASDSHGHSAAAEESLGTAFYIAAGAVPASALVYYVSRPGKDGEPGSLTKFLDGFRHLGETWEARNTAHTALIEQAAADRHLFYNVERNKHIELKFPETFQTGSPRNVPAGHYINLDKVVEHYKQQHLNEEERKAKALAAAANSMV